MRAMMLIALFPLVVLLAQPWAATATGCRSYSSVSALPRTKPGQPTCFTTVSDMFPKKTVASVTGIGGMFGGLGGIVVSKSAGWLFDAYRQAGIAATWQRRRPARWACTSTRFAPCTC